jgi:hypothetical protein
MGFLIDALGLENVTSHDLLVWAAILVLCIMILAFGKLVFRRQKPSIGQHVRCPCGWAGQVSRYAGRCPRCNEPLGEQKGDRKP